MHDKKEKTQSDEGENREGPTEDVIGAYLALW
jgi:hypothetical protein